MIQGSHGQNVVGTTFYSLRRETVLGMPERWVKSGSGSKLSNSLIPLQRPQELHDTDFGDVEEDLCAPGDWGALKEEVEVGGVSIQPSHAMAVGEVLNNLPDLSSADDVEVTECRHSSVPLSHTTRLDDLPKRSLQARMIEPILTAANQSMVQSGEWEMPCSFDPIILSHTEHKRQRSLGCPTGWLLTDLNMSSVKDNDHTSDNDNIKNGNRTRLHV